MHARSTALALSLTALLGGCRAESPADRCPAAPFMGAITSGVILRDAAGTPWTDGTETELVFGAQGAFMVTPVVEIDGGLADGPTPCLRVTLEHRDPAGSPIFDAYRVRESNERFVRTLSGDLATDPIFDPLREAPLPRGTPLEITVTVRGESFAARSTVTVALVPEM